MCDVTDELRTRTVSGLLGNFLKAPDTTAILFRVSSFSKLKFTVIMLFNLPGIIQMDILSKWLGVTDFCQFDSACCNHFDRKTFSVLMSQKSATVTVVGLSESDYVTYLSPWLVYKGLKPDHLVMLGTSIENYNLMEFSRCLDRVVSLDLNLYHYDVGEPGKFTGQLYFSILLQLINQSKRLKKLKIIPPRSYNYLIESMVSGIFAEVLSNLHEIQLCADHTYSWAPHLFFDSLKRVNVNCTQLRKFVFMASTQFSHFPTDLNAKKDWFTPLIAQNKHLTHVELWWSDHTSLNLLTALEQNCSQLQVCFIELKNAFCSAQVMRLVDKCKQLSHLHIRPCVALEPKPVFTNN